MGERMKKTCEKKMRKIEMREKRIKENENRRENGRE